MVGERPAEGARRAIELAYRALSRRDRTVAEVRRLLDRRGVEPEAIESAIAEVTAAGYLDDAAYARRFAEDRRALDRWGSERIARALGERGIAPELVEAAVAPSGGPAAERAAARSLLAERFPRPPRDDRDRGRAWRLLVRRGYSTELAYEAVRAHERLRGADGGDNLR